MKTPFGTRRRASLPKAQNARKARLPFRGAARDAKDFSPHPPAFLIGEGMPEFSPR